MKKNIWAKTILSVYNYLDRVSQAIDKLVKENACNSFYFTGLNQSKNGVMQVADRIIALSERKIKLINLRVLADQALVDCDRGSARILIERYMDCDSAEEIAKRHNLNIRTYFRHLVSAEEEFCSNLARYGYNGDKLLAFLKDERWIMEVYEKYLAQENGEEVEAAA